MSNMRNSPLTEKSVVFSRFELSRSVVNPSLNAVTDNFYQYIDGFEIFESILSPSITGNIYVRDPNALSNVLPFTGLEYVIFEFAVRDSQTNNSRTYGPFGLQIYNQTLRRPINQGTEAYTLGLCSPDMWVAMSRKFSKKYYDFPHKIVEDIVTKPYGFDSSKSFPFVKNGLQTTKSKINFVVPYMRPIEAIQLLTLQGIADNEETNYVFFETLEGYHFSSLQRLIQNGENIQIPTVYMQPAGQRIDGNTKTRIRADKLEIVSGFDTLYALNQGYFRSATIAPDVLSGQCQLELSGVGLNGSYDRRHKINKNGLDLYPPILSLGTPPTPRIFLIPTTSLSAKNTKLTEVDPSIYDNLFAKSIDGRMRELVGLQSRCIRGVVSGTPELHAGSLVNIEFPTTLNNNALGKPVTDIVSGRYLITHSHHVITRTPGTNTFIYETIFEAVTDSIAKSIPDNRNVGVNSPSAASRRETFDEAVAKAASKATGISAPRYRGGGFNNINNR